jgi:hypothetical protein
MPLSIVKETIELESVITDVEGNAWLTKRINLQDGKRHTLHQVDYFVDRYPVLSQGQFVVAEMVVTPYPSIPTNMNFSGAANGGVKSYVAAGDDSVLFKAQLQIFDQVGVSTLNRADSQFPSPEIAAINKSFFYTDHVYINMCLKAASGTVVDGLAVSFLMVLEDKSCSNLEHSIGVLAESHDAMCALTMSNGRMQSRDTLYGNIFPMWRYGGIRSEHMLPPIAANSFFLDIASRDSEEMIDTSAVRQAVGDARQMSAFDTAFGLRRPDWLREFLNAGIEAGAIRPNPVPLRYADNGNTRMF